MRILRVGAVQMDTTDDKEKNLEKAKQLIQDAVSKGAESETFKGKKEG